MASRNPRRSLLPVLGSPQTDFSPLPDKKPFSDAHKGRPCTTCILCNENDVHFTHPVSWKNSSIFTFLRCIEPRLNILPDACICRNCRYSLSSGYRNPDNFKPRWLKVATTQTTECEVPGCTATACRLTKLASKKDIRHHLDCSPLENLDTNKTKLCDKHYRTLHKQVNPSSYQWKCAVCSIAIRGANYSNFRACAEPDLFKKHLIDHTDFDGNITANDKVCMECYRHSLAVVRSEKEKPLITTNQDLKLLIDDINSSMKPLPDNVTDDNQVIDQALKLSAVAIAQQLLKNQALTLGSAYEVFIKNVKSLIPVSTATENMGTPRWFLGQLSLLLKHHLAYTCKVKKHGTTLYRQGKELDCLSHSLFSLKKNQQSEPDYVKVCIKLNNRIRMQAEKSKNSTALLDIEQQIKSTDPVLWDVVCILTQSARERKKKLHPQVYSGRKKNLRRLFILHQLMYCLDSTCSMPFHILAADLMDCHGGSSELVKVFNKLGICVSFDTLQRHIQGTIQHLTNNGLLQGINYNLLTVFTMDNIDFMHSYAQVFSGNQQLSWHGTTLQATQCKPSSCVTSQRVALGTRRSHALLSPINSPDKATRSPLLKKRRARTSTEFKQSVVSTSASSGTIASGYDFNSATTYQPQATVLSIENFRVSYTEKDKVNEFIRHATSYCLLQNGIADGKQLISLQSFFHIATKASIPEVGIVKYVQVLDEVADNKDTVLHIISQLHTEYICKYNQKYLVLEGDAKTYDTMQAIKYEYGHDLNWLIPFPGDWHLLKNYQICLMKPFFEAGLKDLACAGGYPSKSIQNCSQFKRTHRFLLEAWEAMYRAMLHSFLANFQNKQNMKDKIASALKELENKHYDEVALYSVIRSFEEERTDFDKTFSSYVEEISKQDDTWKFWGRFVFEDCQPYIALYIAIRSENWHLRMASLKSMAANFTAFDHPTYQKLISQHIVDVLNMPAELIQYFENGGFVLSISGNVLHSVALDESHEMLINKHIKQTIVRPSKDHINRVVQYMPFRVKSIENLKAQLPVSVKSKKVSTTATSVMFSPDKPTIKSAVNVQCILAKMNDCELFPYKVSANRGLINPLREPKLVATKAQSHDLLEFNKIGRENFELRIKAYLLKTPSVKVPQRRKKLQTFSTTKKGKKREINAAQQELKRVQKCMRRKIAHANKTGSNSDVIGEQYIEFPRALCTIDGLPIKGQKSIATNFYQARYKNAELIIHSFPDNWIPDTVILEGMFLINSKPLHCHRVMRDYGNFLVKRFIVPYLKKGSLEVHVLFDDPGRQSENPKQFEQARRDGALSDHHCFVFFDDAELPTKWQDMIKCRTCKRRLTTYLSDYFVRKIRPFLTVSQKYVTSGATETSVSVVVTKETGAHTWPSIDSCVDESDTRIWLHFKHSVGTKKFILSPDTDVYHIGLPFITSREQVIIQLSRPSDKELKLIDMNVLVDQFKRDPDLVHISELDIPRVMQTLFVVTGCDYISFFSGIGKSFFLKVFFQYANFIMEDLTESLIGSLSHNQQVTDSQLAFFRLVGCAYFKKHANAFYGQTPSSLMNSFSSSSTTVLDQHRKWLDHIRQTIWDRISSENETIPSLEALQYHWLRACWVLHMWQQAQSNQMTLASLNGHGWEVENEQLNIVWDTLDNMRKVKERVRLLMNGCGCKSGCRTRRCGCKKKGSVCGAGCHCVNCENTDISVQDNNIQDEEDHVIRAERYTTLEEDVDQLMETIFGADIDTDDEADDEDHSQTDNDGDNDEASDGDDYASDEGDESPEEDSDESDGSVDEADDGSSDIEMN